MREPLWSLDGVGLLSAGRARLCGVSLTIRAGVTAVVGPSGAGKTSLLNVLAGFEAPTEGRVARPAPQPGVGGRAPTTQPSGPDLFWVPADGALWPQWTVREQIALVHPVPGAAARDAAARLLEALGLEAEASLRPAQLSHGQRQRAALARALCTRARVLLLDEPLVHVDPANAARCRTALARHIEEHGVSLVQAGHDEALLECADDVVCLEQGRVVLHGEVAELRARAAGGGPRPAPAGGAAWLRHALLGGTRLLLLLLATFLGLVPAACSGRAAPLATRQVLLHSLPPCDTKAPAPRCVVPGVAGEWIVLDTAGRVLVLGDDGEVRRHWFMPEHSAGRPEGACLLQDGRIVVADTHYHRLVFFDREGRVVAMSGSEGRGPGQFLYPVRVVQDPAGFLYVAEYGSNDRVQKLRADGSPVLAFGRFGSGPGELQRPSGLAWHAGEVFVTDAMNGRIEVFADDGRFLRTLPAQGSLDLPYDVAVARDGMLYVVEYGAGRVTVMTRAGEVRAAFGSPGSRTGELATPWALTLGEGRVWIADTGNRRLVEVVL